MTRGHSAFALGDFVSNRHPNTCLRTSVPPHCQLFELAIALVLEGSRRWRYLEPGRKCSGPIALQRPFLGVGERAEARSFQSVGRIPPGFRSSAHFPQSAEGAKVPPGKGAIREGFSRKNVRKGIGRYTVGTEAVLKCLISRRF